jgi:hypothetical protein
MAREPAAHARIKAQVWRVLRNGLESHNLPGEALPDGMMVKIDEHTPISPTRWFTATSLLRTTRSSCRRR